MVTFFLIGMMYCKVKEMERALQVEKGKLLKMKKLLEVEKERVEVWKATDEISQKRADFFEKIVTKNNYF